MDYKTPIPDGATSNKKILQIRRNAQSFIKQVIEGNLEKSHKILEEEKKDIKKDKKDKELKMKIIRKASVVNRPLEDDSRSELSEDESIESEQDIQVHQFVNKLQ